MSLLLVRVCSVNPCLHLWQRGSLEDARRGHEARRRSVRLLLGEGDGGWQPVDLDVSRDQSCLGGGRVRVNSKTEASIRDHCAFSHVNVCSIN